MTLRLILTRHAKSDWSTPVADDFDRPLNARGRDAAPKIGAWLADQNVFPDLILCSSAARTRETCELMTANWPEIPQTKFLDKLYLAAPQDMLDILRNKGAGQTLMMIAHNPGTATMAGMLARQPHPHPDFMRYPTAFTTILDFEITDWREADWGLATASAAVSPRDLS